MTQITAVARASTSMPVVAHQTWEKPKPELR
jgi:hypothetical protein